MSDTHAARPGLSIGHENVDGTRVVVLRGEIDHHDRDGLQEALLPPEGSPRTVADFGGVTFMDSSGVDVLIATHQAGGRLRLAGVREPVRRVMALVGIDAFIPCHPTVEDALTG
ncbi:STAS domain-containing protein [Streptomyces viridosporus]|uniref:STAS domain-containing protein n=1 Tax=Streptomyces viridosporus TaxID=67581 RepID=UPI00210001CE|nr:STAS domain-containing protein [Streptomyces viridosporus]